MGQFIMQQTEWKDDMVDVEYKQEGSVKIKAYVQRIRKKDEEYSWTRDLGCYGSKFIYEKYVQIRIGEEQIIARSNGDNTYTIRSPTRPQNTTEDVYVRPPQTVAIVDKPTSAESQRRMKDLSDPWIVMLSVNWDAVQSRGKNYDK